MTADNSRADGEQEFSMEAQMNSKGTLKKIKECLQQQCLERLSRDERDDYQEFFVEDCSCFSKESLNRLNKWDADKGIPKKLYFSLLEAASITNLDQISLLHAGGNGSIVLCTPLPPGMSVAPFYKGTIGYIIEKPEMLVLSEADCRSIELNGFAMQSDFERGYAFTFSEATCIFPGYRNLDYMHREASWKIFVHNCAAHLKVLSNQLFITRSSLGQFLDSQLTSIKKDSLLPEVQSASPTEPWLIKDDDPIPKHHWYTPARYFARQCVNNNPTLAGNRPQLANEVAKLLEQNGIYKRGGEKPLNPTTILKSFYGLTF